MKRWPRLCTWAFSVLSVAPLHADVPIDHPTVMTLAPSNGHRLYLTDLAPSHAISSKIHVVDGDTFKLLGNVHNGQWGFFSVSGDGKTLYNAATFYSRGDHGERAEVLEFYDPRTLRATSEIVLPPRRASTMNYPVFFVESAGARYLFVQNATPATSVTVVDLVNKKVLTEVQTAGCFGIFPSNKEAGRFSTLCGDGTAVTIGFDATGKESGRKRSAKLFDPDKDALFITGLPDGRNNTIFISFLGNVHVVDFNGEVATQQTPWPIVTGKALAEGWRPGGYQVVTYNKVTGDLYVSMHPDGKEGSHKDLAKEIWKVNLAKRAVTLRASGEMASYIVVTQEEKPLVFSFSPVTRVITRFDGVTLKKLGESPQDWVMESGGPILVR